jgi:predicted permease
MNQVTPGYFEALGIHILAGRGFMSKDTANSPKVALVNESFVKRYFGASPAVGRRVGLGSDPGTPTDIEIIGVVNDTKYENLREEIPREMYLCDAQRGASSKVVYVRTERDPENAFATIRAVVHDLAPALPITGMKTLTRQLDESLVTERMVATLSSVFGALATVLAIIGLYGVMAYMVTRRSREIGIRMALGAMRGNVVWLVMREVLTLVGIGIAVGLPAAFALTHLVESQLYGVKASDPAAMALATALLAAVALLAGYIPARRAAGFDPVRVLRYE